MSNGNNGRFPQRKKNALDNRHLKLSAPCPTAQGKWSTLGWGLYKNDQPRITVYTNDPADSGNDNGMIKVPMTAPTFFSLMQWLNVCAASTEVMRHKIEVKDFVYPGGKRSNEKVIVAVLWVGRDEEGQVWLSPQSTDSSRPKIKFPIGPGDSSNWFDAQGSEVSKGTLSKLYTEAYVRMVGDVMTELLVSEYKEPEQKQQGGQQQQQRPQQQQQNNSNNFDDDLPF